MRTRPPAPLPGMALRSRSCSRARRRARGEIRWRSSSRLRGSVVAAAPLPRLEAALLCPAATGMRLSASVTSSGSPEVGDAVSASTAASIKAMSVPTATVSSAWTRILTRRPSTGEGNSAFILSVMISASDSSRSTQSPSFFSQLPIVPSATDSPRRGIFTGVGISLLTPFFRLRCLHSGCCF